MADPAEAAVMVVLTTASDPSEAERLATRLVEERLAACVNIVPGATSIYRWEGEVRRETEALIVLKTTEAVVAQLRDRIVELHPYAVPEVLALPVPVGSEAYLRWVRGEVRPAP